VLWEEDVVEEEEEERCQGRRFLGNRLKQNRS